MKALYIGLMSGTSVNAIDAVLTDLGSEKPRLIAAYEQAIPPDVRTSLLSLNQPGTDEIDLMATLDSSIARLFAQAVNTLLSRAGIDASKVQAIGSHGQTIRHMPDGQEPYTVQIGNPSLIAELTGITTVADFRRRDIAAGGQGAPLAPAFHAAFFTQQEAVQALVNIGGIANVTLLPAANDSSATIIGFDTGPGNALLDAWAERHLGLACDEDGRWAAGGKVLEELLSCCLQDAYFQREAPKSTGRDYFNLEWLESKLSECASTDAEPGDVQATLAALTSHTIADALRRYSTDLSSLLVCGGGVHNPIIMRHLQQYLEPIPVSSTANQNIDPDYLEALGFAWLALQALNRKPGNLPSVTGAAGPRILGGVYFA